MKYAMMSQKWPEPTHQTRDRRQAIGSLPGPQNAAAPDHLSTVNLLSQMMD